MNDSSFNHRTLGDLIDTHVIQVTTGFPFGGHNSNGDGEAHIRPFNVGTDGAIHLEQIKSIPIEAAFEKPRLQYGDIVFNNTNTKELAGKCALWSSEERFVFSNHMTRIRPLKNSVDPAYLSFAIFHHWTTGKSEMLARSHVAQASIIGARFREIEIPWPKVAEQKSIGQLLSQVQKARRTESSQHEQARKLKAETMSQLFTCGLRGEAQRDTEIGKLPESWDLATFADGREWLQYGTSTKCDEKIGDFPVLRIPNIGAGRVLPNILKYCNLPVSEASKYLLEQGDLIFIRTNGVLDRLGSCAVYNGEPKNSLFASYLIRARLKKSVEPRFIAHFYGSTLGTSLVSGRATPASDGKYNLNTGTIDSLPLPLPQSIDEQRNIADVLDAIDQKIEVHQQKRMVLDELFRSLLNKLMTGEISVEDLDLSALTTEELQPDTKAEVQS